jgi:hypothetical protein
MARTMGIDPARLYDEFNDDDDDDFFEYDDDDEPARPRSQPGGKRRPGKPKRKKR